MGQAITKWETTPKITEKDRAIWQLKVQRDRLQHYQRQVNAIIHLL
jgi:hypothetical protein